MKEKEIKKQGKRNRAMGADFERRVRKDLIEKGWIVSKWQNNVNVDFTRIPGKCIPAKPGKFRMMQTGFPDFIAYKMIIPDLPKNLRQANSFMRFDVQFIECKTNGYLSKIEKEKAKWYLKNNYCSKFSVASKYKEKNRVKINYKEFKN